MHTAHLSLTASLAPHVAEYLLSWCNTRVGDRGPSVSSFDDSVFASGEFYVALMRAVWGDDIFHGRDPLAYAKPFSTPSP